MTQATWNLGISMHGKQIQFIIEILSTNKKPTMNQVNS